MRLADIPPSLWTVTYFLYLSFWLSRRYWKSSVWNRNNHEKALLFAQADGGGTPLSSGDGIGGTVSAWEVPEKDAVDAFFAIHTAIPELRDAEALFINPYFIKVGHQHISCLKYDYWTLCLVLILQMGYTTNLDRRMNIRSGKTVGFAETQIGNMMRSLRWCSNTIDLNKMAHATMIGHDCYGKGTKAPPWHLLYKNLDFR